MLSNVVQIYYFCFGIKNTYTQRYMNTKVDIPTKFVFTNKIEKHLEGEGCTMTQQTVTTMSPT